MAKAKAKKKTTAKTKPLGLHMEVHDIWGWVVLAAAALTIMGVAGWYYLTLV